MKWQVNEMRSQWNDKLMKWRVTEMTVDKKKQLQNDSWQNGDGKMTIWQNDNLAKWQFDKITI